jgi:hypothetical protein
MRYAKIAGVVLLTLVVLPLLIVQFLGGSIARGVVNSLNKRFPTEIKIDRYDIGLLGSFPNLSVDLEGVEVGGSDGSDLLRAEHVRCLLDLGSLFGKIRVEEVVIEEGSLQLFVDVDGNGNYQIMGYTSVGDAGRAKEDDLESTEFAIAEARLYDVDVVYQDDQLKTDAFFTVEEASFNGDFGADLYLLTTEASLDVKYIDQEGRRYLDQQRLSLEADTKVNNVDGSYVFAPLKCEAGDLAFSVIGTLSPTEDGLDTDLRVESESGNLDDVLALIPPAYAGNFAELETRGKLSLTGTITGAWTNNNYPRINGTLNFSDGRLGSPRMNIGARDLNLRASFSYADGRQLQTFAIEELTGLFKRQPFAITLYVEDLEDPRVRFTADGSLPLTAITAFMDSESVSDGDGFVRIEDLRIEGQYEDMLRPRRMGAVSAGGKLSFDDGELTINDRDLYFPGGSLELRDNEMILEGFLFEAPGTEISITGQAKNLIPVLFADSLNSNDAELAFDATLTGASLDIDELLALAGPTDTEREEAEASGTTDSLLAKSMERRATITDLLRGRFEANVAEWNYAEVEGENFSGQLIFTPRQLDVRGITQAMDGELKLDGEVYFQEVQWVEGRISAKDIDVQEFFRQGENFGQEVITAANLEGDMDARLYIEAYFDETGALDYDKLRVLAGIGIEEGELRDFDMLEQFAFALKAGDLERVRFTRLENFFEIIDQTLYIPAMFIQSSAINLEISGSHTFNNYLDYYVKVNAGQVVANKLGRHDGDLEILRARRNGFFNVYYTIKGPLETFVTESDKRAVKNDFRRSAYRKKKVQETLEQMFSEPIKLLEDVGETADAEEQ